MWANIDSERLVLSHERRDSDAAFSKSCVTDGVLDGLHGRQSPHLRPSFLQASSGPPGSVVMKVHATSRAHALPVGLVWRCRRTRVVARLPIFARSRATSARGDGRGRVHSLPSDYMAGRADGMNS